MYNDYYGNIYGDSDNNNNMVWKVFLWFINYIYVLNNIERKSIFLLFLW